MRILFLSHYFPPEVNAPASRTYEHAREWARAGHHVTIVTCAPNHPRGRVYEGYTNRLCQKETVDGIDVVRVWTYLSANEGFLKRTVNYVSFMIACMLVAPWTPKCDIVISTSPQFFNGLAGYFVSRLKSAPWLLEIRDLWPESILAVGAISNPTIIRVLQWLESFVYRKANRIVPVTDAFRDYMLAKQVDGRKITVIKNGASLDFYDDRQTDGGLREKLGLQGKFVAAYFGTHGMAHHLETIFEAADILKTDERIVFLMVGDGAEYERLKQHLADTGLKNVLMLGQQPKSMMPSYWALSDVSLVLLRKTDLFKTVIPSKIFEAMAMAKPIIIGVEGESEAIVRAACAGISMPPEDASALVNAVTKLLDNSRLRGEMGQSGKRHVHEFFDRKVLAMRYLDVLSEVACGTSPANLERGPL
jgi:glycosyltransferase involved in cell wall biosynthesis